jgi:translation initiation factor 2-alpha kinase 4
MFAALRDDDDDSSSSENRNIATAAEHVDATQKQKPLEEGNSITVPAYEDLSSGRIDEATVLNAVYGDDFSSEKGVWNYPCWKVNVKPPDITEPEKIGSRLQLHLQLNKKYPYVVPKIDIQNVTGLSPAEQKELRKELHDRASGLAQSGAPMMIELVQVAEDYLLAHNRDPTMSAWEQMQEREKHQRIKENEAAKALDMLMAKEPTSSFEETSSRHRQGQAPAEVGSKDVERELLRQQEAIEAARRLRSTFGDKDLRRTSSGTVDSPRDEDDFDIDLDYNPKAATATASRYVTDFIEMGVLGRGGGGEVVKARNRLDGRVYAIKKILLEREDGAMAKLGARQNQKLRREVTTVSRMTHNNIVRYYQAWVEGDGTEDESTINPHEDFEPSTGPVDVIQEESDGDSATSSDSKGWWTSAPDDQNTKVSYMSSDELKNDDALESSEAKQESDSGLDIFDNDFGIQDPLMSGLGFQNTLYRNLVAQDDDSSSAGEISDWHEESSSVKIGSGVKGRKILYIQMEFCSTTLRKLIDDGELAKMEENEIWRLIRQIVEALAYIHGRKLIHRDLKPGNIFLDTEGNIRLGDFGLATKHKDKVEQDSAEKDDDTEASSLYNAIEDISRLVGNSKSKKSNEGKDIFSPFTSNANESMTGGVGTTFYMAPEQEGGSHQRKGQNYTVHADIFSLGVVLFEMFHPPFSTYMERAENLTLVRGDHATATTIISSSSMTSKEFQQLAAARFPAHFREHVSENAQRLILWCVSRDASKRPTAQELLQSDLVPQKIEVEERYLSEALTLLTNPLSESYMQIIRALFEKPVKDITVVTYDTDVAVQATNIRHGREGKRTLSPSESLLRAVSAIRSGAVDISSLSSLAMSDSSLIAATAALKRASYTGKLGKGGRGMLKRATQRTAGVLAMRAATSAAVTGCVDGVHGADPEVTENICQKLQLICENHGAVRLRTPLLRPRVENVAATGGGPAELLNTRGVVLVLPEDLTVTFARAIGRGGSATSNIKRYDIDRVYHKSLAGGHPREALQASFDIVHEDHGCATEICTETLLVASKVMEILPSQSTQCSVPSLNTRGPPWFIRVNHTRLTEAILDLCLVPPEEPVRRAALAILGRFTAATAYAMKLFLRNKKILVDTQQSQTPSKVCKSRMEEMMLDAERNHGLPHEAVQRLRRFIGCCGVVSPDASQGIDRIKEGVAQLRQHCIKEKTKEVDTKLLKRFEDAARSLKTLRDVITSLERFLEPLASVIPREADRQQSSPLFISIDFGMRQRRKHYHGGIIFQCIVLPDDYLQTSIPDESNEFMISPAGMGVKVAEGGYVANM